MWSLLHVISVVFTVLKLAAVAPFTAWSWTLVLMPSIIGIGIPVLIALGIPLILFLSACSVYLGAYILDTIIGYYRRVTRRIK